MRNAQRRLNRSSRTMIGRPVREPRTLRFFWTCLANIASLPGRYR
jgi:hypothetical protein